MEREERAVGSDFLKEGAWDIACGYRTESVDCDYETVVASDADYMSFGAFERSVDHSHAVARMIAGHVVADIFHTPFALSLIHI